MSDINIGAITEALNDKTDRDMRNVDNTAGADAVIDYQEPNAGNSYIWYRKYKSGWVEQGGYLTKASFSLGSGLTTTYGSVTFPIEMTDNLYNFALGDDMQYFNLHAQSKTTTGFNVIVSNQLPVSYTNGACTARWQVSGMAA